MVNEARVERNFLSLAEIMAKYTVLSGGPVGVTNTTRPRVNDFGSVKIYYRFGLGLSSGSGVRLLLGFTCMGHGRFEDARNK